MLCTSNLSLSHTASHIAPSKGSTCPICTENQQPHPHVRKNRGEGEERNPVKKESCCKACSVQRTEVGFQWLLYFILSTVDVLWKQRPFIKVGVCVPDPNTSRGKTRGSGHAPTIQALGVIDTSHGAAQFKIMGFVSLKTLRDLEYSGSM